MALSLTILMLFLALGSGTAVWAAEAAGSSTLEQHLEKKYVTQQDLQSAPHNVETEDAAIPAKYFEFVCVNHHADGWPVEIGGQDFHFFDQRRQTT